MKRSLSAIWGWTWAANHRAARLQLVDEGCELWGGGRCDQGAALRRQVRQRRVQLHHLRRRRQACRTTSAEVQVMCNHAPPVATTGVSHYMDSSLTCAQQAYLWR